MAWLVGNEPVRFGEATGVAMKHYTSLDGRTLDLSSLSEPEQAFFRRCYAAYEADMPWGEFTNLAERSENPLIEATGGWITRQVLDHPLFQAVHDLESRLGIKQGKLRLAPGQDPGTPPLIQESLPVSGARSG